MGEGRGAYWILVGRPESTKTLGRPRSKWKYNSEMDLREIGIDGANWILLAQYRVRWWAFVNTGELSGSIKREGYFLTS